MGHQREERRGADGLFEETFSTIHNRALHKMESLVGKKSSWELNSSDSRISFLSTPGVLHEALCLQLVIPLSTFYFWP